ncbi:MAG: MCE family protein [Alphaproteobacteria bacterium]|nr:MCE family protein [Alphaproteobacteria bacterium]
MVKQPNMKLIGLFICCSALAILLMFGYFVKSKFDTDEALVVMYFDESVKGLDVGAPVLFKGVKIGEVSEVKLLANLQTMKFLITVYAKIYHGKSLVINRKDKEEEWDRFIKEGLRARLAINSVITGQLLIELDMLPETKVLLHKTLHDSDIFEIPTLSSPFTEISKSLQIMPINRIMQNINVLTEALSSDIPPFVTKMSSTLDTFDTILKENRNNTAKMVEEFGAVAQGIDNMLTENATNISATINSMNEAAQSMKNLTDYLQMYPNAIITGKEY